MQCRLITVHGSCLRGMIFLCLSTQINLPHLFKLSAVGTHVRCESCTPLVAGCVICALLNAVPNLYLHRWKSSVMQQTEYRNNVIIDVSVMKKKKQSVRPPQYTPTPCKWWLEQPPRAVSLEVIAHVNAGLCAPCVYHVCRPSHSENMANFLSQHLSVWWFWPIDLGTGVQCHDPWQVQPHRQFWCFCIWITTWRYNRDLWPLRSSRMSVMRVILVYPYIPSLKFVQTIWLSVR